LPCALDEKLDIGELEQALAMLHHIPCPSLSFRYMKELGMKGSCMAIDLQGMGCGAALPALAQARQYLASHPGHKAMVVSVEICSACLYHDTAMETVVANAIFSDGAAAVLLGDCETTAPCIIDYEPCIKPQNIDKLGFSMKNGKLRIILSADMK